MQFENKLDKKKKKKSCFLLVWGGMILKIPKITLQLLSISDLNIQNHASISGSLIKIKEKLQVFFGDTKIF